MKEMKTLTINGVTYTVTDPDAASIEDSKVGADAWSSKNIVDKLCPAFTESGAIVTCEPVECYPLNVAWESKNLFNLKPPTYSMSVPTSGGSVSNRRGLRLSLPAGTYTISVRSRATTDDDKFIAVTIVGENGAYKRYFQLIWGSTISTNTFTVETDDMICLYHGYSMPSQTQADNAFAVNDIQIEKGNVATAYEPYAETTTITRCGKNLASYPYPNTTKTTNGITFTDNGDGSITANGTATADATFTVVGGNLNCPFSEEMGVGFSGCPSGGSTSTYYMENSYCGLIDSGKGMYLSPTVANSTHKAYWRSNLRIVIKNGCTANNLVFRPCLYYGDIVGYEPYNGEVFSPGDTILALPGINTIFADTGTVTVTGRADPNAINRKTAERLAALEAALVNT